MAASAWLDEHQSGWRLNLASPPLPLMLVSLDTSERKAAVRLLLWPGPARPGWSHAVLMERPEGHAIGINTLNDDELTTLLQALK
jgi:hypothetical protein